jgi:hypothetical protein
MVDDCNVEPTADTKRQHEDCTRGKLTRDRLSDIVEDIKDNNDDGLSTVFFTHCTDKSTLSAKVCLTVHETVYAGSASWTGDPANQTSGIKLHWLLCRLDDTGGGAHLPMLAPSLDHAVHTIRAKAMT